ncbi:unnamed protein product [Rotaria sp. Silwood2]|nr:unnamed protein product [Rotaria sp. Silwood2]CAF4063999.1 unnamed protein product [Rotaria sp. Silwood2]CAF4103150.1 unnamed protein product [Rotaria sp. Silwood2]
MNYNQHVPKTAEHRVLQDPLLIKKKKKCLGNRKLHNFTRKCRAKGMNDQAIEMLLLLKKANGSVHSNLQNTYENPNSASPLINTISNVMNMSTFIGNQYCTNEYQHSDGNLELDSTIESFLYSQSTAKGKWSSPSTTRFPKRRQRYNLCNDHWKQMSKLIPNYKKLSPYQFKDALMKVIPASSQHHIKEYYINVAMLQFVQQRTEIICHILQLKIEQDYWNNIDNLITMPVVIWLSEVGKDVTKKNSINWDHTKTKFNIQHRQTIIQNRLQEAENSLNFHLQQSYPLDCELNNKTALPLEEQNLSQRLNELSMTSRHTPEHLIMVDEDHAENIPYYLSKESKSFQEITSHLSPNELIEELRQMAIVIHQLFMIDLEKSLWTTYLKSGTGQLQLNHMDNDNIIHPHLWSVQVQKLVSKQSLDNTDTATCLTYVTQHLDELDDKMKQYQTKYNMKKNQYLNYLSKIQTFVHQQLESARLTTEQQIALVRYNYNDHVFKLKFRTFNPTREQKQVVQKLDEAKYHQETTKAEYNLLTYRISMEKSSRISIDLPEEKFLKTIEDGSIRQKLHDQYVNIAKQARKDILKLCLSTAQIQKDQSTEEFNTKLEQFKLKQQSLLNHKKFTSNMINLMEEHWKQISESVECVYKYKLDLLRLNSVHN